VRFRALAPGPWPDPQRGKSRRCKHKQRTAAEEITPGQSKEPGHRPAGQTQAKQTDSHPARQARAARLLAHWDLENFLTPNQVLATIDTYRQWVDAKFKPTQQFIEVPFTHTTPDGQQATGFIDHLLLTPKGPIILDHKIFPGPEAMWSQTALSYSGQLTLYQQVVSAEFPDDPKAECWIHLVSSGAAALVCK
jgi:hypothetical protein